MKASEKKVIDMAVRWFNSKRPIVFKKKVHYANPTVNLSTDAEKSLARAVVNYKKKK